MNVANLLKSVGRAQGCNVYNYFDLVKVANHLEAVSSTLTREIFVFGRRSSGLRIHWLSIHQRVTVHCRCQTEARSIGDINRQSVFAMYLAVYDVRTTSTQRLELCKVN